MAFIGSKKLLACLMCVCLVSADFYGWFAGGGGVAHAGSAVIPVEADAYVDGGSGVLSNRDANFNFNELRIKEDLHNLGDTPYTRRAYMRFDLGGLGSAASIEEVKLKVYASAASTEDAIKVYAVMDDTWQENTITWNTKPADGDEVGTLWLGTAAGYYEVDLTDYIRESVQDGKASIMLMNTENNGRVLAAKEATDAARRPILEVLADDEAPKLSSANVESGYANIVMNFDETLSVPPGHSLKEGIVLSRNGAAYVELGDEDAVQLDGSRIIVTLERPLEGTGNKVKLKAGFLSDEAGNAIMADIETKPLSGMPIGDQPVLLNARVEQSGFSVVLQFDRDVEPASSSNDLKSQVELSEDDGSSYRVLGVTEHVTTQDDRLIVTFEEALSNKSYRFKIASGALIGTGQDNMYNAEIVTGTIRGRENDSKLIAVADARVDSAVANLNVNYGSESSMILKEGTDVYNRRIFLKFDLSEAGLFNSAKLRLYFQDAAAVAETLSVYGVADDSWTESGITYQNQPAFASAVASSSVGGANANGWYEWDVSDYMRQEQLGNGVASLLLRGTPDYNRHLYARETVTYAPQLVLTFDETAPAYRTSRVSDQNRQVAVVFDERIVSAAADAAALKDGISLSRNGSSFSPLETGDTVAIEGDSLVIRLADRLAAPGAALKLSGGLIQDANGNVYSAALDIGSLDYDAEAPKLEAAVRVSPSNTELVVKADEQLYSNMGGATVLKDALRIAEDGETYRELTASENAAIVGDTLVIALAEPLDAVAARMKVTGGALKDGSGNVLLSDYVSEPFGADREGPLPQSAYVVNFNKKAVIVFNEVVYNALADEEALKAAVERSTDGGVAYQPLGENDKAGISGSSLMISLDAPLEGESNRFRIAAGALRDAAGNVSESSLITEPIPAVAAGYPYAPPGEEYLEAAMIDSANITFSNADAALGSTPEATMSGALAILTMAIASGDRNPEYIDRFTESIRKMLTVKANMPNLMGGLDSRSQSQMVYALAMLWNDEEIMSRFTEDEMSKIVTFLKAGLISTAYTLSDFDEHDLPRSAQRIAVNGDDNAWNGGNTNHSEPNVTILFAASLALGLENVKPILQQFDLDEFIAELDAQGLTAISDSFKSTTRFGTLANKAALMENIVSSGKWSFKGVSMDEYLSNPMSLYHATQSYMWSLIAEDGDYIGEPGMAQEFNSSDHAGNRQSASYVVLGIDPSLLNRVLLDYYGYWSAPGNEAVANEIDAWQRVGVSDYYAKVVNGYYTQSWSGTHMEYLTTMKYFIDTMITLGMLNPAVFNDTFNYGAGPLESPKWVATAGNWTVETGSIIPYNTKIPLTSAEGALPVDPNEKILRQTDSSQPGIVYTNHIFGDVQHMAWIEAPQSGEVGLLARAGGKGDYYLFSYDASSGQAVIRKKQEGSTTTLAETEAEWSPGEAGRLRAMLKGGTLEFHLNGRKLLEAFDTNPLPAGAVGLYTNGAASAFDGVLVQNTIPPAPSNVAARTGNGQVELRFDRVEGAMMYRVRYGMAPGVYTHEMLTSRSAPVITGLVNDTAYYFAVTAVTPAGESALSAEVSMAPRVPTAARPTLNALIADDNRVAVLFTEDPINTSYVIRMGSESGKYTTVIEDVPGSGYYIDLPGSQRDFHIVVSGANANGESAPSDEMSVRGNGTRLFTDDMSGNGLSLSWFVSTGGFRKSDDGGTPAVVADGNDPDRAWVPFGLGWTDYRMKAEVSLPLDGHGTASEAYLMGRTTDANNYYLAGLKKDWMTGRETVLIRKKQGGAFTVVKETEFAIPSGTFALEAEWDGNEIRVYVNGELVLEAVDASPLLVGTAGLLAGQSLARFGNVSVELLNALEAPSIASFDSTSGSITLTLNETEGAEGYRIKYGTTAGSYSAQLTVSEEAEDIHIPNLTPGTTYYVTVSAFTSALESANAEPAAIATKGTSGSGDHTSGGGGGTGEQAGENEEDGNVIVLKPVTQEGMAQASVTLEAIERALPAASADGGGRRTVYISLEAAEDATGYTQQLPAALFSGQYKDRLARIVIQSPIGEIGLPSGMFEGREWSGSSPIGIAVRIADRQGWSETALQQVGDRPAVELWFERDGQRLPWSSDRSSVDVSLEYEPTEREREDSERLVILYVEADGAVQPVPSGRYQSDEGRIVFKTNHFSTFAVSYRIRSFNDLSGHEWARKPIEVMASKGVINGISDEAFSPGAVITRGDFLLLLARTLQLQAAPGETFDDVSPEHYAYEAIHAARALGMVQGKGNNRFKPDDAITRQEMFVMIAKALEAAGVQLPPAGADSTGLNEFADRWDVADYAVASAEALTSVGIVAGDGVSLKPRANAVRAEAAVLMYRIYNL